MSKQGINRVTLVGNVGNEPSVHKTDTDKTVVKVSVATSESYGAADERVTQTEWHSVVFFNGLADIAEKYLEKGHKVYIEGKLKSHKWVDKEGNDRNSTEIIASEMQILSSRKDHETTETEKKNNNEKKGVASKSNTRGSAKEAA